MRPASLAAVLIALLAASPARAQRPSDEEAARQHYDLGRQHYDNGRYEAAVAEFQSAYALSPRPELQYNLYLAYERMGRYDLALASLDDYLAHGTMPEAERAQLESRRQELGRRAANGPAGAAAPPRGHRRETGDLLLRVALGFGYTNAETDAYRVFGGSGHATLLAGISLGERFAVHATLWGASLVRPTIRGKQGLVSLFQFEDSTRYASAALGVGGSFYLPDRFYLSASLGAASVSAENGSNKFTSDAGLALLFLGGKDWSIGGHWVFGIAAGASVQAVPGTISNGVSSQDNAATVLMIGVLGTVAYD